MNVSFFLRPAFAAICAVILIAPAAKADQLDRQKAFQAIRAAEGTLDLYMVLPHCINYRITHISRPDPAQVQQVWEQDFATVKERVRQGNTRNVESWGPQLRLQQHLGPRPEHVRGKILLATLVNHGLVHDPIIQHTTDALAPTMQICVVATTAGSRFGLRFGAPSLESCAAIVVQRIAPDEVTGIRTRGSSAEAHYSRREIRTGFGHQQQQIVEALKPHAVFQAVRYDRRCGGVPFNQAQIPRSGRMEFELWDDGWRLSR